MMLAYEYGFGLACCGAGFLLGAADMVTPAAGRWIGGIALVIGMSLYIGMPHV